MAKISPYKIFIQFKNNQSSLEIVLKADDNIREKLQKEWDDSEKTVRIGDHFVDLKEILYMRIEGVKT